MYLRGYSSNILNFTSTSQLSFGNSNAYTDKMFAIHRLSSTCKLKRHTSCHFKNCQNLASSNSSFSRVREDTNIPLIASYSPHIGQCFKPVLKLVQRIYIFQRFPFFTALWIVIFLGNLDTTVTSVPLAISFSGFRRGDSPSR